MKKFLKIFIFFFSFCFIGSVKALDYDLNTGFMVNNRLINNEFIDSIWEQVEGKTGQELGLSSHPSYVYHKEDFPYMYIQPTQYSEPLIFFANSIEFAHYDDPYNNHHYNYNIAILNAIVLRVHVYNGKFEYANDKSIQINNSGGFYPKKAITSFDFYINDNLVLPQSFTYQTISKEYYAKIHLNGGIYANLIKIPIEMYLEDFDTPVFTDLVEASTYFYELVNGDSETPKPGINFSNDGMIFDGLFFEPNFRHEFIYSFTEDIQRLADEHDLYVKWRYNSYDSLIENETLLNMTYDDNYSYMYVTHQDSSDIYIGLPFNDMLVSAYGYNSETNTYNQEAAIGLTPLFEKDGYYYYILRNDDRFDNWVMVVERNSFQNNNYNFKITNNAYITYGNDLTNAEININGNLINTNINDVFGSAKDEYINNSNDLISTLKNLIGNHKSLIQTFSDVFDKLKGTQLWNYFMLLIVGACIIMIIKTANRK